jgi:hypothetical protein
MTRYMRNPACTRCGSTGVPLEWDGRCLDCFRLPPEPDRIYGTLAECEQDTKPGAVLAPAGIELARRIGLADVF